LLLNKEILWQRAYTREKCTADDSDKFSCGEKWKILSVSCCESKQELIEKNKKPK
jgi:hypothetical protein